MSSREELEQETVELPEDYQIFADAHMPFTTEETLGTFCSTWRINNWSAIGNSATESQVRGPIFKTDDYEWDLLLYPKGNSKPNQHVSLFLESVDLKNGTATEDICAQALLCMVDPTDPTRFMHQVIQHRFDSRECDYGFAQYVSLKQLLDGDEEYEPYVINDCVTIVAIVRLVKDTTGVLWHKFANYDSKEMTGYVGLYNQGATCYMNSLFQSLFFTNLYRKSVYQIPTENDNPESSSVYALQRLFYHLQFSDTAVSTTELTKSFGWNSIDSFMQHDVQEFNRLLQDNIEKKMKGTPAEDSIKQLFVGKMKSYIKCINVDYESARSEDYYDIQLNVKGCKNLEESFKNYILEETLEGDNKYMAEGYGLQDAKKGVIFESFPPVLHLQLKRFEYDMMKDSMVKINDRHEFPTEIDLQPYLSESADKLEPYKYILHGVLVHTGDLTSGHYFAFVRPGRKDKWFKFDDDRVTPASLNQVLEDNFGRENAHANPATRHRRSNNNNKSEMRFTNAYMLVYIRESHQERVLENVTENDIPSHLVKRINREKLALEEFQKQKAQQHLYVKAYITTDYSFMMNTGPGFVHFDESRPTNPPIVHTEQVLKSQLLRDYVIAYAEKYHIQSHERLRFWNLANRRNGNVQLDRPFADDDLDLTLEQLCFKMGDFPFLRFYAEYSDFSDSNGAPFFHEPCSNIALIFVKLFDPVTQTLSGLGKIYVYKDSLVSNVEGKLKVMANFDEETMIDLYEEEGFGAMHLIDKTKTFEQNDIEDGDIICFQNQEVSLEYIQIASDQDYFYTNVADYMSYLYNRIHITFSPKYCLQQDPEENTPTAAEFTIELRKDMLYDEVVLRLGAYLGCDPKHLLLIIPDYYGTPNRSIKPVPGMVLLDILQLIPKPKINSRRHEDNGGYILSKLYYDILSINVSEYQSQKLIKVNVCYPTVSAIHKYAEFVLPRFATIADVCKKIDPMCQVSLYQVVDCKICKNFKPDEVIGICIDDEAILHAEVVTKEEHDVQQGELDFKVPVFHYQRELTQTHSVPFNFLIIKDEEFSKTKKRLQERAGMLNDEEREKVKIGIISRSRKTAISEDDKFILFNHIKVGDEIGLNHLDPNGRYKAPFADRGLFIKE